MHVCGKPEDMYWSVYIWHTQMLLVVLNQTQFSRASFLSTFCLTVTRHGWKYDPGQKTAWNYLKLILNVHIFWDNQPQPVVQFITDFLIHLYRGAQLISGGSLDTFYIIISLAHTGCPKAGLVCISCFGAVQVDRIVTVLHGACSKSYMPGLSKNSLESKSRIQLSYLL